MTPDEITALMRRAHVVRFKLENLTEDMNEMLREFEAMLATRFKTNAKIRFDPWGYLRFANGVIIAGKDERAPPLLSLSREIRKNALGKMAELYHAVAIAQREYDANEGRPA